MTTPKNINRLTTPDIVAVHSPMIRQINLGLCAAFIGKRLLKSSKIKAGTTCLVPWQCSVFRQGGRASGIVGQWAESGCIPPGKLHENPKSFSLPGGRYDRALNARPVDNSDQNSDLFVLEALD